MKKSILNTAILLSVGTFGCAGWGVQQTPAFATAERTDPGSRGLGPLWEGSRESQDNPMSGVTQSGSRIRGADLWNPAPVIRSDTAGSASSRSRVSGWNGDIGILQF